MANGVHLNAQRQLLTDTSVAGSAVRSLAAYGSMLLSAASDSAIATTLANVLTLSVDAVSLDSETLIFQTGGVSSVSVHFSVIAQAVDFPGTTFTGDVNAAVYAKIAGALNESVTTGAFKITLRTEATAQNAPQLLALTNVTFTGATFTVLSTSSAGEEKQNGLSESSFAGLVIGVLLAMAATIVFVVLYIRSQSDAYSSGSAVVAPSPAAMVVLKEEEEDVVFDPLKSDEVQLTEFEDGSFLL